METRAFPLGRYTIAERRRIWDTETPKPATPATPEVPKPAVQPPAADAAERVKAAQEKIQIGARLSEFGKTVQPGLQVMQIASAIIPELRTLKDVSSITSTGLTVGGAVTKAVGEVQLEKSQPRVDNAKNAETSASREKEKPQSFEAQMEKLIKSLIEWIEKWFETSIKKMENSTKEKSPPEENVQEPKTPKEQLAVKTAQKEKNEAEIGNIDKKMAAAKTNRQEMEGKLATLQGKIDGEVDETKKKTLQTEISQMKSGIETLKKTENDFNDQRNELKAENDTLNQEIKKLKDGVKTDEATQNLVRDFKNGLDPALAETVGDFTVNETTKGITLGANKGALHYIAALTPGIGNKGELSVDDLRQMSNFVKSDGFKGLKLNSLVDMKTAMEKVLSLSEIRTKLKTSESFVQARNQLGILIQEHIKKSNVLSNSFTSTNDAGVSLEVEYQKLIAMRNTLAMIEYGEPVQALRGLAELPAILKELKLPPIMNT